MHQTDPSQGELSFELLAEIAVGATARIELCRVVDGPLKSELVAVKRLHPHIADDPQFVDMFRDEVWMTAALKHPNVVEVVGWGQDGVGPWLAVEFVKGVSMQRLMKTVFETGERFTERMVVYLARCMCDGLAEAHALRAASGNHLNLVHRDLTPGNVLLSFDGQIKITDFGLAKAKQRLTRTLTGLLKGQPQYMSPEQVQGGQLDGRSDVFALGVVLFELFSGRRPWAAMTDLDAMRAITEDDPVDLGTLRPRIDKALVEIVSRCLIKDVNGRFQSAAELRDRFDEWLNAHGYRSDNDVSLARFVRRNAMRQMRWFERAIAGEFADEARQNQPMPMRMSSPPQAPMPPPATSSARTAERSDPRDLHPPSTRAVPEQRAEAPTRIQQDGPDAPSSRVANDSIDWGDDGPTLIQKSEAARGAIERSRQRASTARLDDPNTAEPSTARRRREPAMRSRMESDDSTEHETVPGRRQDVVAELEKAQRRAAADRTGATMPLGEVGHGIQSLMREPGLRHPDALGVVAPPDPDVPPVPPSRPQAKTIKHERGSPPAAPAREPRGDELRLYPPSASAAPVTPPSTGPHAHDPRLGHARQRAPVDQSGATRPLSTEDIDPGLAERPFALGAMPVPRFPSLPSMSNEHRSSDFNAEARRLAGVAMRAADFAEAAARAARLAAEAALAAADGARHDAIVRLRDAQNIEDKLNAGELPSRASIDLTATEGGARSLRRLTLLARRDVLTMSLVVAIGVLMAVLLVVALT